MKVIIFGASGAIGKLALKYALLKGYDVTAYVRNSNKINIQNDKLHIIEGEISDYDAVEKAVRGNDAVVWCVGVKMKNKYPVMESLEGHKILLKAMNSCGVKRLIDWATPSVTFHKDKKSFITVVPSIIAGIALKQSKKEMIAIGELIRLSSLEWTLVRFIAPTNSNFTGKIKVSFGDVKIKFSISRDDIAYFMIEQIESKEYINSMPIIGS
ncbi:NAD(P)-dependent oxidoreductase [Brachyspira alvinipulli]|uniref:NAD(P)-dependent oxidoreductase n=1 Tax=Brachyspira alvinipulli TaxID=84379 RepID=UPI00047FDABD|nr:NAD(P)H-binding protein [Brachyspira alvinipulli]